MHGLFIYFFARKAPHKIKPRQVIKPFDFIDKTVWWCRKVYGQNCSCCNSFLFL